MALTFPLNRATFFAGLKVANTRFWLDQAVQVARTGGGEIIPSQHGTRLWNAEITIIPARHADASAVDAVLSLLCDPGASFLAYDKVKAYPASDPNCTILGAATPVIANFNGNNRDITIQGLPSGYVLSAGDFVSFTYGSPTRYALHKIVVGATASVGGQAVVEVVPNIRPGATVGVAVTLNKPWAKMRLKPGSYQPGASVPMITSGMTFSAIQTLR